MRSGGEGPCGENTSQEAAIPEESVIIISDDEADVSLGLGNSVLLIEDPNEDSILQEKKTLEVVDEELAITFSRRANVMPHARYDCSTHAFNRMEQETQVPVEKNASFCDECYCYLCDKPASECSYWSTIGSCHCNAHNKSKFWKDQRDNALVGVLTIFNLDLTEIDTEMKEGGNKLQLFLLALLPVYHKYLAGTLMTRESMHGCVCACHKEKVANAKCNPCSMNHVPVKFHSYADVHKMVTDYLNQVDEESPKAAAVMLLGTAKQLVFHKAIPNPFTSKDSVANIKASSVVLMTRIVSTLQRLLVLKDYPKTLFDKFVIFFQSLPLPPHFYGFTSSMNVIRWDNCLLTSVLNGQNVTGIRTNKGKKEFLWEALPVVQSRVKRLEDEKSYRQLVRYLNAVRCSEYAGLNSLKQKLCLYMCKCGDYSSAANSLLTTKGLQGSISKFFTPALLELHLAMLRTRSCPPGNKLELSDVWVPQEGLPLKKGVLLRTALRVLYCNNNLFQETKFWSVLVRIWCMSETLSKEGRLLPLCLFEPDKILQQTVMGMSCTILDELQRQTNVHLPEPFHKSYYSTAELILLVQAVVRYMMATNPPLRGMLELVAGFGDYATQCPPDDAHRTTLLPGSRNDYLLGTCDHSEVSTTKHLQNRRLPLNHWALSLLIEGISPMRELLFQFVSSVNKDLYEDEPRILGLFKSRGPNYVSHLVPVFFLHPNEGVRSIGFHLIDVVLRNITGLSWSGAVGNSLKMKVLPFTHMYMISSIEHQKLMTSIGRLTARS